MARTGRETGRVDSEGAGLDTALPLGPVDGPDFQLGLGRAAAQDQLRVGAPFDVLEQGKQFWIKRPGNLSSVASPCPVRSWPSRTFLLSIWASVN